MKRVWKPLDVKGLRLYKVKMEFARHPEWNRSMIVAAQSPGQAARMIKRTHEGIQWLDNDIPTFQGYALTVYQPREWIE